MGERLVLRCRLNDNRVLRTRGSRMSIVRQTYLLSVRKTMISLTVAVRLCLAGLVVRF
jgi:hypothetical protein